MPASTSVPWKLAGLAKFGRSASCRFIPVSRVSHVPFKSFVSCLRQWCVLQQCGWSHWCLMSEGFPARYALTPPCPWSAPTQQIGYSGAQKRECVNNRGDGQDPGNGNHGGPMVHHQTTCVRSSATKKARRVLAIGDASLREEKV